MYRTTVDKTRGELTVQAFYRDDDFRDMKNGRRLIDEGRWNFLE